MDYFILNTLLIDLLGKYICIFKDIFLKNALRCKECITCTDDMIQVGR